MSDPNCSIEDLDITKVIRDLEALDYGDNFGSPYIDESHTSECETIAELNSQQGGILR